MAEDTGPRGVGGGSVSREREAAAKSGSHRGCARGGLPRPLPQPHTQRLSSKPQESATCKGGPGRDSAPGTSPQQPSPSTGSRVSPQARASSLHSRWALDRALSLRPHPGEKRKKTAICLMKASGLRERTQINQQESSLWESRSCLKTKHKETQPHVQLTASKR